MVKKGGENGFEAHFSVNMRIFERKGTLFLLPSFAVSLSISLTRFLCYRYRHCECRTEVDPYRRKGLQHRWTLYRHTWRRWLHDGCTQQGHLHCRWQASDGEVT